MTTTIIPKISNDSQFDHDQSFQMLQKATSPLYQANQIKMKTVQT